MFSMMGKLSYIIHTTIEIQAVSLLGIAKYYYRKLGVRRKRMGYNPILYIQVV